MDRDWERDWWSEGAQMGWLQQVHMLVLPAAWLLFFTRKDRAQLANEFSHGNNPTIRAQRIRRGNTCREVTWVGLEGGLRAGLVRRASMINCTRGTVSAAAAAGD